MARDGERTPSIPWLASRPGFQTTLKRWEGAQMNQVCTATAALLLLLMDAAASPPSLAQSNPIYHHLGQTDTALYTPDSGPAPHVGIIVMHREADYMNNIACTEFAKRGFMVLCMNSRFENNESVVARSEEHTSELQSLRHLVCRLLLEKKKHITY